MRLVVDSAATFVAGRVVARPAHLREVVARALRADERQRIRRVAARLAHHRHRPRHRALLSQPTHELVERADRAALILDLERAPRESLGEKAPAFTVGKLGRLDHADFGEQRDFDDELEPPWAERHRVVAQIEQRLVVAGIVVRNDRRERRRHRRVERGECLRPVSEALARLLDDEEGFDERRDSVGGHSSRAYEEQWRCQRPRM